MQTMYLKRFLKIKEEKFEAGGGNGIKSTLFIKDCFDVDHFKAFIEFVTISLLLCFVVFCFGCEAHGINPAPLALRAHF